MTEKDKPDELLDKRIQDLISQIEECYEKEGRMVKREDQRYPVIWPSREELIWEFAESVKALVESCTSDRRKSPTNKE